MRSHAWFFAPVATALVALAAQGCSSETVVPSGTQGAGGGTGGDGGSSSTTTPNGGGGSGGDGGASDGGGGAGPNPVTDTCPVDGSIALHLTAGDPTTTLHGTTVGATDDFQKDCGNGAGDGPDAVATITADTAGTLTLTLKSSGGLNGQMFISKTCDAALVYCADQNGANQDETFTLPVLAGETYFVQVDGRGATEGDFELAVRLQEGKCGDGVINTDKNEACEDSNTKNGDGCSSTCQFEEPTVADTCPGQVVNLDAGTHTINGHTTGFTGNFLTCFTSEEQVDPDCDPLATDCEMYNAPDAVYQVIPSVSGMLHVELPNNYFESGGTQTGFDGALGIWKGTAGDTTGCTPDDFASALQCSDDPGEQGDADFVELLDQHVDAGFRYYIVVDAYYPFVYGQFKLKLELTAD